MKKENNEIIKVKDSAIDDNNNEKQLWWNNQGYQVAKGFKENFSNVKSEYKKVESSEETSNGLFRRPAQMSGALILRSEEEYKRFVAQSGKRFVSSLRFLTFIRKSSVETEVDHFTLKNMTLMRVDRIRDGVIGKIKVNVVFEEYEVIKQDILGDDRTSPGVSPKVRTSKLTEKNQSEIEKSLHGQGYTKRITKDGKEEWYNPTTGELYGGE